MNYQLSQPSQHTLNLRYWTFLGKKNHTDPPADRGEGAHPETTSLTPEKKELGPEGKVVEGIWQTIMPRINGPRVHHGAKTKPAASPPVTKKSRPTVEPVHEAKEMHGKKLTRVDFLRSATQPKPPQTKTKDLPASKLIVQSELVSAQPSSSLIEDQTSAPQNMDDRQSVKRNRGSKPLLPHQMPGTDDDPDSDYSPTPPGSTSTNTLDRIWPLKRARVAPHQLLHLLLSLLPLQAHEH